MKTKAMFASMSFLFAAAMVLSQGKAQQAPAPEKEVTVTAIPGVIAAGTKVERVWTGLNAGDGLIAEPNGTLLLPEQGDANAIGRVDEKGKVTSYLSDTNEAGGVAIDPKGRVIDIERKTPSRIRLLAPERKVLAETFEGKPFQRLSDIVADKKGGVWVTESPSSSVFYLSADGKLSRAADDVKNANGIMLSPDEKTLYVTSGEAGIFAYDVQTDNTLKNRRSFAKPEGGVDGLAIDAAGRVYDCSNLGVQVFSPKGEHLGLIPIPRPTTTLAFAGPDKKTLYVIGRGNDGPGGNGPNARSMYKIAMVAQGFKGRPK
jgi:sugar lactone lactonase YvrE